MADYSKETKNAFNKIKEKGQAIDFLVNAGQGEYDPVLGIYPSPPTPIKIGSYCVITEYEQKYVDGRTIQQGDKKALVPGIKGDGSELVLTRDMQLEESNGDVWSLVLIGSVAPAGKTILFKLQLRK